MTTNTITSDIINSDNSNSQFIDLSGCTSVLVEVESGHCLLNDMLPLRSSRISETERGVISRLFECRAGIFAADQKITIRGYNKANSTYKLIVTRIKTTISNKDTEC
jgi:hypothetical protein